MNRLLFIAFIIPFVLNSCAIYLDEPVDEEFTGIVRYQNGNPASNVNVEVTSYRDYFPIFLMLAPHQPPAFRVDGRTDQYGRYSILSPVSKSPSVTATLSNPSPDVYEPKFIGMTNKIKNGDIVLQSWEEHINSRKSRLENRVGGRF